MRKISGFSFNRVVIIQSLEKHEVQTGTTISDYIRAQLQEAQKDLPVECLNCESSVEFLGILEELTKRSTLHGDIPILHVECHGDEIEGVEFANGSMLSWQDLSSALVKLNKATQFNLMAIFSACYGGHFLGQMGAINPSPCWCMVAPSEVVDSAEIMAGFRLFYRIFFLESDAGRAVHELSKNQLSAGRWFGQPAEPWFEVVVGNYITTHCTPKLIKSRAKELAEISVVQGNPISMCEAKKRIKALNRKKVFIDHFNCYFMTADIPQNKIRFKGVMEALESKYSRFKNSGVFA